MPFRKGEVGGERGFEAALALRDFDEPASVLDGERRKTNMKMHKTTPTIMVSGLVRRSDRTGPIAPFGMLGVLNGWVVVRFIGLALVS